MFAVFTQFFADKERDYSTIGGFLFTDGGAQLFTDNSLPLYTS